MNLLARDLDFLAVEAVSARQELADGTLHGERMLMRVHQFIEECEFLARSGARHLKAMGSV